MFIKKLASTRLHIPFVHSFKHASAERSRSSSLWVEAHSERYTGFGEGCPRPYVSGETLDSAETFLQRNQTAIRNEIKDLETLKKWVDVNRKTIDDHPAAWCAIELALLDLLGKETRQSVESLLGLPALSGSFHYSAVLGDSEINVFRSQLYQFISLGFADFKIKLSGKLAKDKPKLFLVSEKLKHTERIRLDANNVWSNPEKAIKHISSLDTPVFAVEEPVKAFDYSSMEKIAHELDTRIILDESFLNIRHINRIADNPSSWIINLRVSKMGGLLRSLEIIERAKKAEIKIIIGAHVGETSLLTRAALPLARAADSKLTAQEGAFGTLLLKQDIVPSSLVFGGKGILEPKRFIEPERNGFGLDFRNPN